MLSKSIGFAALFITTIDCSEFPNSIDNLPIPQPLENLGVILPQQLPPLLPMQNNGFSAQEIPTSECTDRQFDSPPPRIPPAAPQFDTADSHPPARSSSESNDGDRVGPVQDTQTQAHIPDAITSQMSAVADSLNAAAVPTTVSDGNGMPERSVSPLSGGSYLPTDQRHQDWTQLDPQRSRDDVPHAPYPDPKSFNLAASGSAPLMHHTPNAPYSHSPILPAAGSLSPDFTHNDNSLRILPRVPPTTPDQDMCDDLPVDPQTSYQQAMHAAAAVINDGIQLRSIRHGQISPTNSDDQPPRTTMLPPNMHNTAVPPLNLAGVRSDDSTNDGDHRQARPMLPTVVHIPTQTMDAAAAIMHGNIPHHISPINSGNDPMVAMSQGYAPVPPLNLQNLPGADDGNRQGHIPVPPGDSPSDAGERNKNGCKGWV